LNKKKIELKILSGYLAIPFVMVVPMAIGYFFGEWLDDYFNTKPYLALTFLGFGCLAGGVEFVRIIKRLWNEN
jgi:F0F1-type ATP synthase assembly protein I